jgi:3-oxoacyl-[acyl-carrier protein] reductase
MLTRTLAVEVGASGVRVNTVAPGFIATPMTSVHWTNADGSVDEARKAAILATRAQQSPLGVTGEPSDIALAMLYLAADASRFVTGQVMRPNGGVSMVP